MKTKKLVFGIGVNDADYVVEKKETSIVNGKKKWKLVWKCKFYRTWTSMLNRCYSKKFQEKNPTYRGCTVSDDWLYFSNFRKWMEQQDWQGKELDKDILFEDNKVYSAETCVFVSRMVNMFVTDSGASRGECLLGVDWQKAVKKFRSRCSNPFTKTNEYLGLFTTEIEAYGAWRKRKLELAYELAAIQTDPRVAKALIDRYS